MTKEQSKFFIAELQKMTALMEQEGAVLEEQIRIRKEKEKMLKEWEHV